MKRILCTLAFWAMGLACFGGRYSADWQSLNEHPCPQWWQDAKFGIFIHWGVYSVPAFADPEADPAWWRYAEQYWLLKEKNPVARAYHEKHYQGKDYRDFAKQFSAKDFDPRRWADLFRRAGARYVVLTSRHHDGFTLWPSPLAPGWNAGEVGPKRDLCGELSSAVKAAGLRMGFYFSHLQWHHPLYTRMGVTNFVETVNLPQLKDLVVRYRPDIIWGDGEWDYPWTVWRGPEFLQWLYNDSPVRETVVVNDRWGAGLRGKCGDFYSTEYSEINGLTNTAFRRPFEECRGIGYSFGYNRLETTRHYHTDKDCIEELVEKVSRGGNLLLNIGPDADGLIPVIMEERLLAMGRWLETNGEAIYGSRKGTLRPDGKHVYCTDGDNVKYVFDFRLDGKPLVVSGADGVSEVSLIGSDASVSYASNGGILTLTPPALPPSLMPSVHAWVYRIRK